MVDWSRVLLDLRFTYRYSATQIGREVGLSHTQVSRLSSNGQPFHSNGERIIELWIKQTGKTRDDLPLC